MSTLADLFNNRISLTRKVVFAEGYKKGYQVYIVQLKGEEPLKVEIFWVDKDNLEDSFTEHDILKEDLYIILHPDFYYKNSIQLPILDLQKLEAILPNEIIDYLPDEDENDYSGSGTKNIVDFDIFNKRIIAYSIKDYFILKLLNDLGSYSSNLKAIIPYGSILRDLFISQLYTENWTKIIMIENNRDGIEVWGFSEDANGEIVQSVDWQQGYKQDGYENFEKIFPAILSVKKFYKEDRCLLFEKANHGMPWDEIANRIGLRYFKINFEKYFKNFPIYEIDDVHKITLYSFLNYLKKNTKKVNLLKGPFKPSIKNYIRVKDFALVGILILFLAGFSAGRFFIDMSFLKNRVFNLKDSISNLTENTFGQKLTSVKTAVKLLTSIKNESKVLERNIGRRYSALKLFKEFTASLPVDVELEYTDILIEQNRIRFNGKTKSFSDIDKIKESLNNSEYFKEVRVTNSGTTGSTGGFIVNFQFDIKCNIE